MVASIAGIWFRRVRHERPASTAPRIQSRGERLRKSSGKRSGRKTHVGYSDRLTWTKNTTGGELARARVRPAAVPKAIARSTAGRGRGQSRAKAQQSAQ
jgi:hypothetical protein